MMEVRNKNKCCVDGCPNKRSDSVMSFFKLPSDTVRRNAWLRKIGRFDLLNKTCLMRHGYRVCSVHFERSMMYSTITRKLLSGAMPTKHLPRRVGSTKPSTSKCDASTQTKLSVLLVDESLSQNDNDSNAKKSNETQQEATTRKSKLALQLENSEEKKKA